MKKRGVGAGFEIKKIEPLIVYIWIRLARARCSLTIIDMFGTFILYF